MIDELVQCGLAGRKLPFRLIDAHAHWGRWQNYDTLSAQDCLAEMDRLGVEVMACSSLLALAGEVRRGNDELAELLRQHPGRFVGYVHVGAAYPEQMAGELERCLAMPGFVGIKIYQQGINYDDVAFESVFELAAARQLPVLAHNWGARLMGLEKMAEKFPSVPVLLAHSGSDMAYKAYAKLARQMPNLYLDLTLSRGYAGGVEYFVEQIGAERVVWGSDEPLFSMANQMGKVLFARISSSQKRMILRDNAARLFKLPA